MKVFDGYLEAVETSSFWQSYLGCKVAAQVFIHDPVGGDKKGKEVGYEVMFTRG
jgi:hypothetical protein